MDKKYIIIALVLLVLISVGGVYFWKTKRQKSVTDVVNPIETVEVANPYDKTNPFSDIKINPFE